VNDRNPRAFTVLELSISMALIAIIMTLVVARFDWAGPHQQLIAEARRLGHAIELLREKAVDEGRIYAMQLNVRAGTYSTFQPLERSTSALETSKPLKTTALPKSVRFQSIAVNGKDSGTALNIFFDPHGIVTPISIRLLHEYGCALTIKLEPLSNEVTYAEH